MAKVWIIQENNKLNPAQAQRFGKLEVIFRADQQVKIAGDAMMSQAREILGQYNTNTDFLLLMGDPAAIAIVVGLLVGEFKHETLDLLKWDRIANDYYPVNLSFS